MRYYVLYVKNTFHFRSRTIKQSTHQTRFFAFWNSHSVFFLVVFHASRFQLLNSIEHSVTIIQSYKNLSLINSIFRTVHHIRDIDEWINLPSKTDTSNDERVESSEKMTQLKSLTSNGISTSCPTAIFLDFSLTFLPWSVSWMNRTCSY